MSLIASTLAAAAGDRAPTWRTKATTEWSYDNVTDPIGGVATRGVRFKPDGSRLYIASATNDTVYGFELETPWDLTGPVYSTGETYSFAGQEATPFGIHFKPDGTSFYILGSSSDTPYQYNMTTPWDVTTASLYGAGFSLSAVEGTPTGIYIQPDGSRVFFLGSTSQYVRSYPLRTPWDITSMNAGGPIIKYVGAEEAAPMDLAFSNDGDKLYICGTSSDRVHYYELSTPWSVNTASLVSNFSVASQTATPYGLTFKTDGTKMYIVGNDIWQYST